MKSLPSPLTRFESALRSWLRKPSGFTRKTRPLPEQFGLTAEQAAESIRKVEAEVERNPF